MRLKALMTTPVEVISPHASISTAERRLKRKGVHHLVVVDHDRVVGLVTTDTLRERAAEGATCVEDALIRNISVLNPEMTVTEAAALMMPGQPQTAVPVISQERLVGIVTVADLLEMAGQRGARTRTGASPRSHRHSPTTAVGSKQPG